MSNTIVELSSPETSSVGGGNPIIIALGLASAYAAYKAADEVYKLGKEAVTGFVEGVQSEM